MAKTNKELALKIAKFSASEGADKNEWWGHDTSVGNLPRDIEKELDDFEKVIKQEMAKSFQKWIDEHTGYFCNDCFLELRKQRWLSGKNK